jgi:pimeloyl-ACP methyl ester carboxylesterase
VSLPVLLLPGTLCTGAIFEKQLEALASLANRVETVPFRDERSIDEMAETVAGCIPPETGAAIAGFSMGGMVAMALARRHPGLVRKLALINTNSHAELPDRGKARQAHLAEARRRGVGKVVRDHYLPRYLERQSPEHRRLIIDMSEELGLDCFEAQAQALGSRPDSTTTLQGVACHTLILGSSGDALCPPEAHVEMHRIVSNSDLVLLGACGHFSTLERPEAVSSCLCSWYLQ